MPSAQVIIESDRFDQFARETERAIERAIGAATSVGVAAARSAPTSYRIHDRVLGKIRGTPVRRTRTGHEGGIEAPDFLSVIFEKGSYKRRSGKLKKPRRSASGSRGVKPVRFLSRGLRAARPALLEALRREIGRIR